MDHKANSLGLLLLLTVVGARYSSGDTMVSRHPARSLIPLGQLTVDLMEPTITSRHSELILRFQNSVREHGTWLQEYIKSEGASGGALPYHPNMGLSRAEYQELREFSEGMRLSATSQATLEITEPSPGVFVLNGGQELPELTGIVVDLTNDEVRTPLGNAKSRGTVEATVAQKATGPWNGISWTTEELEPESMTGYIVKFHLGRLVESGRGILYFDAKRLADGEMQRATRIVTYSLGSP